MLVNIRFHALVIFGLLASTIATAIAGTPEKKSCGCLFEVVGMCVPKPCFYEDSVTDLWSKKTTTEIVFPTDPSGKKGGDFSTLPIFATGYSELTALGGEDKNYGLYSYAIVTSNTPRNVAFMKTIFTSVPSADVIGVNKLEINILYIPVMGSKKAEFLKLKQSAPDGAKLAEQYMNSYFDRTMAIDILHRICQDAEGKMRELCESDTDEGPFLFTYAKPVTGLTKVPPPYLFADLRKVHERAFPTILSRFKEQVKSDNFSEDARINTFGNRLLSIVLTAADWTDSVKREITDAVHAIGLVSTKKN